MDTLAAFGKIHVLCNNAGVVAGGPMERITPGDWDWVIGVELMGAVYGIQAFLPHLKAQGEGGHVVTVASMAGMLSVPGMGVHVAAKFGLVGLSETLAAELAGTSIGVSVLCCLTVPAIVQSVTARRRRLPRRRRPILPPLFV